MCSLFIFRLCWYSLKERSFHRLCSHEYELHLSQQVKEQEYDKYPQSLPGISVAIGIFFFSLAGHPSLPEVYLSMREPKKFERVLEICFVIMVFTYTAMALFGYLQFGRETSVVITENLVNNSSNAGQVMIGKILTAFIVASCYFQVSPFLSVSANVLEDLCAFEAPITKRVFRTVMFCSIAVVSWFVRDDLGTLIAVVGSVCTTITSAICPALFYFGLNKNMMGRGEITFLIFFLFVGLSIGLFTFYNDIVGLISGMD